MNCDQVFDVLTRGPFPTGAESDAEVERHLGYCVDCRRLATALRPAVELFEEAVRPEESRGLPSYWGEAVEPHSAAHDATFATLEEEIVLARGFRRRSSTLSRSRRLMPERMLDDCDRLIRFCGAVAVGVVLAFTFRSFGESQPRGGLSAAATVGAARWQVCSAAFRSERGPLAAGAAMHSVGPVRQESLDSARHRCCSECHFFGGVAEHVRAERVATSCVACHQSPADEPDEQESMLESQGTLGNPPQPGV